MYPIMLSDTSLGLGLAPETTCQFRTPALERPARNQTINILFFYFSLKTHFVTCALRETGLKLLLRSPCLYIDVSVLYISPLRSNSSSLRCYERTLAVININFISSFCAFFFSSFNIFLAGHLLLLVRSFLFRTGFDLYHHSDALRFMQFLWALGSDLSTIQNT